MKKRLIPLIVLLLIVAGLGYKAGQAQSRKDLQTMFRMFTRVLKTIEINYVEEEDPADLVEKGIEGMVNSLDPYSDFLTPDESEEWDIRTRGEFGGLGIQISQIDGWITVIAPIEGTPAYRAGIMAGDRIVEIEGKSSWGMKLRDAVKKLRGEPGTKVTIKVKREGVDEPIEFTITREIIHIKTVPFYTMLDGKVGYVSLSSFSSSARRELKSAIDSLLAEGAQKLILDLRGNPGGLLQEAIEVSNLFLPRGRIIVSTRGRIPQSRMEYRAMHDPEIDEDMPLVVLVNHGSASASEIVSGAIQDWDRGLIIGDTTFGKGSVQRIYEIEDSYKLKITTAKYYTPSGRCIHREEKEDTTGAVPPDSADTARTEQVYHTKKLGRPVYGGGGIIPDIVMEAEKLTGLTSKTLAKRIFFDYAVEYKAKHPQNPSEGRSIVNGAVLEDFKKYLKSRDIDFTDDQFAESRDQIKRLLEMEIQEKYFGTKGRYWAALKDDKVVQKALEVLTRAKKADDLFGFLNDKNG